MRSRLKSNVKKQSIHIIVFIVAIFIFLIIFGSKIIIGLSIGLDKLNSSKKENITHQSVDYVAPPVIYPLSEATKDEKIDIKGSVTSAGVSVKLFINGKLIDDVMPGKDGEFIFEKATLKPGDNEIKTKSISSSKKESIYSDSINIKYLNKNPDLEITTPTDGQSFKKDQSPIRISGKTNEGVKVTVNDFWTIIDDNGEFYYMYSLKDGGNNLKIIAIDEAGNTTTKEININVE